MCTRFVAVSQNWCVTICTGVNEVKCKSRQTCYSVNKGMSNSTSLIALLKWVVSSKRLLRNESWQTIMFTVARSQLFDYVYCNKMLSTHVKKNEIKNVHSILDRGILI